jgi:hypothetical protein
MVSTRDFIQSRRAEIKSQMVDLNVELRALATVEKILGRKPGRAAEAGAADKRGTRAKLSIKDMILSVLHNRPEGADKRTLIGLIGDAHGTDVSANSLGVELSRLKAQGVLRREGQAWRLTAEPAQDKRKTEAKAEGLSPRRAQRSELKVRDLITDVLRDHPEGADRRSIRNLIHEKHGVEVRITTLAAELSRLTRNHLLSHKGRAYRVNGS